MHRLSLSGDRYWSDINAFYNSKIFAPIFFAVTYKVETLSDMYILHIVVVMCVACETATLHGTYWLLWNLYFFENVFIAFIYFVTRTSLFAVN